MGANSLFENMAWEVPISIFPEIKLIIIITIIIIVIIIILIAVVVVAVVVEVVVLIIISSWSLNTVMTSGGV